MNLSNEFVVASFGHEKFLEWKVVKQVLGFTLKYREDPIF